MNLPRLTERRSTRRKSLGRLLYRALGVALASVCMAGLAVAVVGLLTLRAYAEHNLHLIGRSMAYTVEAAVVNDSAAAEPCAWWPAPRKCAAAPCTTPRAACWRPGSATTE